MSTTGIAEESLAPLAGKRLLVTGAAGRLAGELLHALFAHRHDVGEVVALVRARSREDATARARASLFGNADVVAWPAALRVVVGDVCAPGLGLDAATLESLRGIDAIVHLAGTSSPNPALDHGLALECEGMDHVVEVAQRLGGVPVLYASSLEVVGTREGMIAETDPCRPPYPRGLGKGASSWSVQSEREACADAIRYAERRARHADATARTEESARQALYARKEPSSGGALADYAELLSERELRERLVESGRHRARGWGFVTTRGYLKALAEQTLATSGLPHAVVRVAPLGRGALPLPEGRAAPLAELKQKLASGAAAPEEPGAELSLIPADLAARGLLVALSALVSGRAVPLAHLALTGDSGLSLPRLIDLVDIHVRRQKRPRPARSLEESALYTARDTAGRVAAEARATFGSRALEAGIARLARRADRTGLAHALVEAARELLPPPAEALDLDREEDVPLIGSETRLRAAALARLARQLGGPEQTFFNPAGFDWRRYLLDVHLPALDDHRAGPSSRRDDPLRPYDTLLHLLDEAAERYRSEPALSLLEGEERHDVSYRELRARVAAVTERLRSAGVEPGDAVLIAGRNHPSWPICAFGILGAGGVCVPVDPALSHEQVRHIVSKARVRLAIVDKSAREAFGAELKEPVLDMKLTAAEGSSFARDVTWHEAQPDDVASILFTSGTTGDPKGVMLTHANFTSLIASLGRVFDMHGQDRALSVLPLHHTLEFSCGLLLPLAAGAQVFYLDEITGERVLYALREGRITGMVGVPALWQLLERRIRTQVKERGASFEEAFSLVLKLNQTLGKRLGLDLGRLFFKTIHDELGGHLRTLISGGAALPSDTHQLFQGLGLHLAEGYGLTETAPVLTVAEGVPGAVPGTVGKAIPGVEVKIDAPDDNGVGEVLARGPNVMKGYFENDEATAAVKDGEWLRTGDLGRIDERGRLTIVGRAKDVVVTASGENVYLDDVEDRLGAIAHIDEYTLVGLPDPRGGERLCLAAVAHEGVREEDAKDALKAAVRKLPAVFRASVVELVPGPLPRTATRKVKRKDVRPLLEAALARAEAEGAGDAGALEDALARSVIGAIAAVAGVDVARVNGATNLQTDLGFDSLMWVELASALEPIAGKLDAEMLFEAETVAALVRVVGSSDESTRARKSSAKKSAAENAQDERRIILPASLRRAAKGALGVAQRDLYRTVFETHVEGRAYIPQNRNAIVVANHSSHLDTGLVKFALGRYGQGLRPFAAKDYFFEGNRFKVAFFENLTNLVPLDRESGSGAAFEQTVEVVNAGHVVLIYPEGTRRTDGTLGDFKPLVGRLSMMTGAPVLPVHLAGTFDALPKGAAFPRARDLKVRIGPPLFAEDLRRLTEGETPVEAARHASSIVREAVAALARGEVLDISHLNRKDLPSVHHSNAR